MIPQLIGSFPRNHMTETFNRRPRNMSFGVLTKQTGGQDTKRNGPTGENSIGNKHFVLGWNKSARGGALDASAGKR